MGRYKRSKPKKKDKRKEFKLSTRDLFTYVNINFKSLSDKSFLNILEENFEEGDGDFDSDHYYYNEITTKYTISVKDGETYVVCCVMISEYDPEGSNESYDTFGCSHNENDIYDVISKTDGEVKLKNRSDAIKKVIGHLVG